MKEPISVYILLGKAEETMNTMCAHGLLDCRVYDVIAHQVKEILNAIKIEFLLSINFYD